MHADFNIQGTLKIIKTKNSLEFTNPGSLKIDLESIFKGGNSKSRNPRIQKMFSFIGLGEGAGSGFSKILSTWNEQNWRIPELKEDSNLHQVSLKLWMVSMLPEECLDDLKRIFGYSFKYFNKDEVLILATSLLEGSVNNARIQLMMDKHSFEITIMLRNLVEQHALIEDGYGKGKIYYLNNNYVMESTDNFYFSEDEVKINDYIKENSSINNQQSRKEFGFGKDKNITLFNSLMEKGKIKKVGNGKYTKYNLIDD